jgi:hypothetical protein
MREPHAVCLMKMGNEKPVGFKRISNENSYDYKIQLDPVISICYAF